MIDQEQLGTVLYQRQAQFTIGYPDKRVIGHDLAQL